MRRVVVFMGGSPDVVSALHQSLPGTISSLGREGVLVPKAGRTGNKTTGLSHQPLATKSGGAWPAVQAEARASDAETVLLVIPGLLRLGATTARRLPILRKLATLGDQVVLVSVVGEQLTMINDFYLSRVATWRIARRLETSVQRLIDNEAFVHETLLRPWYEDRSVRYVALPLPFFTAGNPIVSVLAAASVTITGDLPRPAADDLPKLGSVGVEANRLLAMYLRAEIPGMRYDDEGVPAASLSGLSRAQKLGWCADRFWGWTPRAVEKALGRFDASNNRFAQAVWGTDWTLTYPVERPCTQVDFLDLDFPVVDQIHRYVMSMADKVARERKAPS